MPTQRQTRAEIRAIEIPQEKETLGDGIEVIAYIRVTGFEKRPAEQERWEVFEPFKMLDRFADRNDIAWLAKHDSAPACATAIDKIPVRKCWGFVELLREPTNTEARVIVALFQRSNLFNEEEVLDLQKILEKIREKAKLMAYIEIPRGGDEEQRPRYRYVPPKQGGATEVPQDLPPSTPAQPVMDPTLPQAAESDDQPQGEDDDMRESAITKANAMVYATNLELIKAVQAICPNAKSGTLSAMFHQAANGELRMLAHWRALVHEANRRGCPTDEGRVTKCNWNFDGLMKVDPLTPVMALEEAIAIVQGNAPRPPTGQAGGGASAPPPPAPAPHAEPQEERAIVHATAADLVLDGLVEELNGDPAMRHALVKFVAVKLVPVLRNAKKGLPVAPSERTYEAILDDVLAKAIPPDKP